MLAMMVSIGDILKLIFERKKCPNKPKCCITDWDWVWREEGYFSKLPMIFQSNVIPNLLKYLESFNFLFYQIFKIALNFQKLRIFQKSVSAREF